MALGGQARAMSLKRGSRNTLQMQRTLDSSMAGIQDARFGMYNKDMIKNHLEKRRGQRRAQSNIRPSQRFSTITAFHKDDV